MDGDRNSRQANNGYATENVPKNNKNKTEQCSMANKCGNLEFVFQRCRFNYDFLSLAAMTTPMTTTKGAISLNKVVTTEPPKVNVTTTLITTTTPAYKNKYNMVRSFLSLNTFRK